MPDLIADTNLCIIAVSIWIALFTVVSILDRIGRILIEIKNLIAQK